MCLFLQDNSFNKVYNNKLDLNHVLIGTVQKYIQQSKEKMGNANMARFLRELDI